MGSALTAAFAVSDVPKPPVIPFGAAEPTVTLGHWLVKPCRELNKRVCDLSSELLNSQAVGVILQLEWRDLEQNGDNGWTFENLDATFAKLKRYNKKMAIQFFFTVFGDYQGCLNGSTTNCNPLTPSFMWDDCATYGGDKKSYPNVQCSSYIGDVNGDIYIHKHNPNVRRQMHELFAKINSQYGSDPDFEALFIPESTQRGGIPDGGWSRGAHVDAMLDMAAKARDALPNKAIYYMTNFLPAEERFNGDATAFMEYLIKTYNVWISWPDTPTCRNATLLANQHFARDKYGGTPKVFPQQQALNYQDSRTSCLSTSPWAQEMYDYIVRNVNPGAIGWHSEFWGSSTTSFSDLERQVISNKSNPIPLR
jgi:hypothetical protein